MPITRLSAEELQQIFSKMSPRQKPARTEQQQGALQAWTANKHQERQKHYKERMAELREAEKHPYKPKALNVSQKQYEERMAELREAEKHPYMLKALNVSQKQYKERMADLREAEKHPYKPKALNVSVQTFGV